MAPGRICLFGEHQDYLGLPVIAAAVSLEIEINLIPEDDGLNRYRLILHDLDRDEIINTALPIIYQHRKDYLRSVVKTLRREGIAIPRALTAEVKSRIPVAAGASSSTAFTVAWTGALLKAARHPGAADPGFVAHISHLSEVAEFKESGGMMDQTAVTRGGLCFFHRDGDPSFVSLRARPEGFVIGDSRRPKDTQAVLSRVRGRMEGAMKKIRAGTMPGFSLEESSPAEVAEAVAGSSLDSAEKDVLLGNLENRDILRAAFDLLSSDDFEPDKLGNLLTRHHEILRDNLGISTDKIEKMIEAAMNAGALGCKINGSGGGGCMFAYAPGRSKETAEAIEGAGGTAYTVEIADGLRVTEEKCDSG